MSDIGFIPKSEARKFMKETSDVSFAFGYICGLVQSILVFLSVIWVCISHHWLVWVKP